MNARTKTQAIGAALLAALFYAINIPCAKLLLRAVPSTVLAGLLYLGAGLGIGALFLRTRTRGDRLTRADLPYTVGMVALDIAAPILLMYGLANTSSANAALLNNFEIVATTVIALVFFREKVSRMLWAAIALVTLAGGILSFEGADGLRFAWGSLFVLGAAVCWGFENNCTRRIADKNTYEIVTVKGLCCGTGALCIAFVSGQRLPDAGAVLAALLLGFVSYGLSILFYIRAQSVLGAAKTGAYYAAAPFAGALLSFVVLREPLTPQLLLALLLMLPGCALATADTLRREHRHTHTHTITHTHGGSTHTHTVTHSHPHRHYTNGEAHRHVHLGAAHTGEI